MRREIAIPLLGGLFVGVAIEEKFDFRARLHDETRLSGPCYLALENLPRAHLDRLASVLVDEVADHQRRSFDPRDHAQRGHIGHGFEIAVTRFPVGESVTGKNIHLAVDGEQIITGQEAFFAS